MTRTGRGLTTKAIAVVEAADGEFFAMVDADEAVEMLRRLIQPKNK